MAKGDIVIKDQDPIIDPFDNKELIAKQTKLALQMKREGHDWFQISRALTKLSGRSVSVKLTKMRVQHHWKQIEQDSCEEHLRWELARLDDLLNRYYKILRRWGDDPDTVAKIGAQILKVMERRARYLGLDAPQRVNATVTETTQADLELQDMVNEQRAANAVKEQELRERARRSS